MRWYKYDDECCQRYKKQMKWWIIFYIFVVAVVRLILQIRCTLMLFNPTLQTPLSCFKFNIVFFALMRKKKKKEHNKHCNSLIYMPKTSANKTRNKTMCVNQANTTIQTSQQIKIKCVRPVLFSILTKKQNLKCIPRLNVCYAVDLCIVI